MSQPALCVSIPGGKAASPIVEYRSASAVARILIGRKPAEITGLLGQIFSICPASQRWAAELAISAALGHFASDTRLDDCAALARAEIGREHSLRILLGWGALLGEEIDRKRAAQINSASRHGSIETVAAIIDEAIFGGDARGWLALARGSGVADWARQGQTLAGRFIARSLGSTDLPAPPQPSPQSLLSRHAGHRAIKMLTEDDHWTAAYHVSRLLDLAQLVAGYDLTFVSRSFANSDGKGEALVPCSRGTLHHCVTLESGRVAAYDITSPTDLSFAHNGDGTAWLASTATLAASSRKAAAQEILGAIDPCVEYRVETT